MLLFSALTGSYKLIQSMSTQWSEYPIADLNKKGLPAEGFKLKILELITLVFFYLT